MYVETTPLENHKRDLERPLQLGRCPLNPDPLSRSAYEHFISLMPLIDSLPLSSHPFFLLYHTRVEQFFLDSLDDKSFSPRFETKKRRRRRRIRGNRQAPLA